jgi:hypothetical protein
MLYEGIGQVHWSFLNKFGQSVIMQITCLYVPDAQAQLLPPHQLSEYHDTNETNGSWIGFSEHALVFYEGNCIRFPYNETTNLPIAKLAPGITKTKHFSVPPMNLQAPHPVVQTTCLLHHENCYKSIID